MLQKGGTERQQIVGACQIIMRDLAHPEAGIRRGEDCRRVGAIIEQQFPADTPHKARKQIGEGPAERPTDQRRSSGMLLELSYPLADPFFPGD